METLRRNQLLARLRASEIERLDVLGNHATLRRVDCVYGARTMKTFALDESTAGSGSPPPAAPALSL